MDIMTQIRKKISTVILSGMLLAALSFLFLSISEERYRVGTDYLLVQNSADTTDTYALAKSAEYTGKILSEGIYSELFINEVAKTGKVNSEFLPFDKKDKLKKWSTIVNVGQNGNLGMINVSVFEDNQRQALLISEAISEVLTSKNYLFLGEGQRIDVRVLTGPVLEKNPSFANMAIAVFGGFVFGAFVSLVWIYFRVNRIPRSFESSVVFHDSINTTKQRMQSAGIFAEDGNYLESLRKME